MVCRTYLHLGIKSKLSVEAIGIIYELSFQIKAIQLVLADYRTVQVRLKTKIVAGLATRQLAPLILANQVMNKP